MPKTGKQRFDDSIVYIRSKVSSDLADHIKQLILQAAPTINRMASAFDEVGVGDAFSLSGAKTWWFARDQNKRHALRALLLCQSVYFSQVGARISTVGSGAAWAACDFLPANMVRTSSDYWKSRSEVEILEAIKTFTVTADDINTLVTAAQQPGDALATMPSLKVTRTTVPFPGHKTCYTSVMFWLFRAGLVSYRWMMRHNMGNIAPVKLAEALGPGIVIWPPNKPFTDLDSLPAIARGKIVHLYIDTPYSVGGHWMVRRDDDPGGAVNGNYGAGQAIALSFRAVMLQHGVSASDINIAGIASTGRNREGQAARTVEKPVLFI